MPGSKAGVPAAAPAAAPEAAAAEANAGSDDEEAQQVPQGPQKSRRLRSCITGVQTWWTDVLDLLLPPPPTPISKLSRKERTAKKLANQTEKMRKQLYKQGFDLKKVNLAHLSDKRLREFAATLDENKKRIFIKAPQWAVYSAAKMLQDIHKPVTEKIKIPWGLKKGVPITAQLVFSPEDPPFDPDDPGPKQGFMRLTVIQEGGFLGDEKKDVYVGGVLTTTGTDNVVVVKLLFNVGEIQIMCNDEPSRWKWFCSVNAALHRVSAAKVMLDQPAALVPWHDQAIIEQEEEN